VSINRVTTEREPSRGGDIEILKFIHDYRLLRIHELEALTGRKYQRMHGRLKGLFDNRYLGRLEFPWKKDIYHIAKPGLTVLLREGLITDEQAERRVREGELKSADFLEHELMISDFHVMLTLATYNSSFELVAWKEGTEIHDSFEAFVDGRIK
jgi:Replication-relaxation